MATARSAKSNQVRCSFVAGEITAPSSFRIFKNGWTEADNDVGHHSVFCDENIAKQVISKFEALGRDIVIDYEHQTAKGVKAPAAGWITSIEWRDDGLWANCNWTEIAEAHITSREYRYFSPTFLYDRKNGKLEEIFCVALTNQPATIGIEPLAAKGGMMIAPPKELLDKLGLPEGSDWGAIYDVINAIQGKQINDAAMTAMCKDIGIEGATSFKSLLTKVGERITETNKMAEDAKKTNDDAVTLAAKADETKNTEVASLKAELETLKAKDKARDLEVFLAKGTSEGKIDANNRDLAEFMFKGDEAKATAWLTSAPKIVNLTSLTGGGADQPGLTTAQLTDPVMRNAAKFDGNRTGDHQKIMAKMAENKNNDYVGAARELNLA